MLCSAQYTITDKNDVYIGPMPPENPVENQLWLDTSITPNQMKRYNSSVWTLLNNRTFVSDTEPIGALPGDLWIKSSEGNKLYRREGTAWNSYQDQTIPTLNSAVENMVLALSGGSRIFRQNDPPSSGMGRGDLWFDTDDSNKCYRYTTTWVLTSLTNVIDSLDQVARSMMTPDEIISTVRSSPLYANDLDGKANASQLVGLASETFVNDAISTEIQQRNTAITEGVASEKTRAENVEGQIKAFTDLAQGYLVFDLTNPDTTKRGAKFSKPGSPYDLFFGDGKISFLQGETEVAYVQNSKFYIVAAQISDKMTIGNAASGFTDIVTENDGLSATWRSV